MEFRKYGSVCLCADAFPEDTEKVTEPFAPLILLTSSDPLKGPCLSPIHSLPGTVLEPFVEEFGAAKLNTAFPKAFDWLRHLSNPKRSGYRVTLVGLGDVGGTVLLGLKLLGKELHEIAIFDPNEAACRRYEMELNQVLSPDGDNLPRVTICKEEDLFNCDLFLFTASRGVPPVGSQVKDVRMIQFEQNREMLRFYAKKAREANFLGLFCQISDPVDHLARAIFLDSNRNEAGEFDFLGLLPEQIQGFGLGVMAARANYAAREMGLDPETVRVYGPHGAGLVAANAAKDGYDDDLSRTLTQRTRDMNLRVRQLGYKPYLAPGLSSAAVSILQLLRGQRHYGAVPLDGVYFGCESTFTPLGIEVYREPLAPLLAQRLAACKKELQQFSY